MDFPVEFVQFLKKVERVAALTGAGVSQESGLRTFREAQTGLWTQYSPTDLASPDAFARNPKLVWDWYAMRREKVGEAEPNPGHFALVDLAHHIPDFSLITQNVDGLHRRAGSPRVIELHGNLGRVRCSLCGQQVEAWEDAGDNVPKCEACGGLLRPDVVWFGESLPGEELNAAIEATRLCQVFFSIGTSGMVYPAAALAHAAKKQGSVVVEINAEPTPLTESADFALHGRSGEVLPALVKAVWG